VLAAILLPAVQAARESARATSCRNNLKQIATAILLYHDSASRLPAARMERSGGVTGTSTFFMILPYLEEQASVDQFDKTQIYSGAANVRIANTIMPVFLCPSMVLPRDVPDPDPACGEQGAPGSYAVSTGSTNSFAPNHPVFNLPPHDGAIIHPKYGPVTLAKVVDGTSRTLLVGEMDYGLVNLSWGCKPPGTSRWGQTRWAAAYPGVTWGSALAPINSERIATLTAGIFPDEAEAFRSDHSGGVHFAFVDGSVRFLNEDIDLTIYRALATRDGSETIDFEGD
jgi:prepilin-type processing-associated H-X9-DG protein